MVALVVNESNGGIGLLAVSSVFIGFVVFVVVLSFVSDWIKKKGQESATDSFEPYVYRPKKASPPPGQPAKPLSAWEEEIRKMLQAETAPPPVPPQPIRQSPPPLPDFECDPLVNETEGRAENPIPTYLASMEQPDGAFDRGSHVEDRVRARLRDASDHSDADAAFARVQQMDDVIARRLAAAGALRQGKTTAAAPARPTVSRAELGLLVSALRSPGHAKGAVVASVILGPPKALER